MISLEEKDFSEKIDLSIWKKILKHMFKFKKEFALLCLNMMCVSTMDLMPALMSKYAIDNIIAYGLIEKLLFFFIIFFTGGILQGLFIRSFIYTAGKLEALTAHSMRREAFAHTHKLSFSFHDRTPVGYLMARLTSDITYLGDAIAWSIVDVVWAVAILIGATIIMLITDWRLALMVLIVVPPLSLIMIYFQRKILNLQREVKKTNSRITRSQNESIVGARTSKSLVIEEQNLEDFKQLTGNYRHKSIRSQSLSSFFWPLITTLGSVAMGVVLWQGGTIAMQDIAKLGTFTMFISYATQFFEPINNIARISAEMQSAQASAERVVQLIETPLAINEKPGVEEKFGTIYESKKENWPAVKGDVKFEHVSFHYNEEEDVLKDFSLNVSKGETIALVGETGSGKSTIVNLLCRFYEPVEGEIYIDGTEYREFSQHWLQSNIGYVLQTPHLFSGTIEDNIRYGKPDATSEEVLAAAELVNAHPFISKMKKGYKTAVGEGGSLLSTGEKQLISFARAVLINPAIFVLDEATSSIDTETEQLIQNAITKVLKGRTSFIIAHRLSTIRNADMILVVRGGEVVEKGCHDSLMELKGYYYNLYTNQFKEDQQKQLLK